MSESPPVLAMAPGCQSLLEASLRPERRGRGTITSCPLPGALGSWSNPMSTPSVLIERMTALVIGVICWIQCGATRDKTLEHFPESS